MAAYREEVNSRLPNTTNILSTVGIILREHLKRAAEHCETKAPLEEWDSICDTVIANHLLDAIETVRVGYVHVRIEPEKKKDPPGSPDNPIGYNNLGDFL